MIGEPELTAGRESFKSLDTKIIYELLRYDFVSQGKKGNFPDWYTHNYSKEAHRALLMENGGITNARLDYANSEYEEFKLNPLAENPEILPENQNFPMLLRYNQTIKK